MGGWKGLLEECQTHGPTTYRVRCARRPGRCSRRGSPSTAQYSCLSVRRRPGAVPRTALSLCPGPEVGAVVVFGLTADRNSLTDFPILWACQRIADCSDCAGAQAMNADRVIKSNVELFNTGTWAGSIWRKDTISARVDNVQATTGRRSVQKYPADRELPQTH